mgnify:CR=1 FL=1
MAGFDAVLPQFEAAGAQVVGVSGDAWQALAAWRTQNNIKHLQLSDIRRQMLPAYDAMITDEKGDYKVLELRPGTYTVTYTLPGFSTFKRDGLELGANFTATINVELKVGGIEETVTVSGEAPLVDTTNTSQQRSISQALLNTVPTSKSTFAFVALMPAAMARMMSST